jgi:hypothetical protein
VFGFNYTELDINRSRSFGVAPRMASVGQGRHALFQADSTRSPTKPRTSGWS